METFTAARDFCDDPRYETRRREAISHLDLDAIDRPIVDLIAGLSQLPFCYTLQCCFGHFVHAGQPDPRGLDPLAHYAPDAAIQYRIAYLAVCIRNGPAGRRLHDGLQKIARADPDSIQFGSADWFWRQHVNSYVLQAEPARAKLHDTAMVGPAEALHLQSVRVRMFEAVREISRAPGISQEGDQPARA